MGKIVTRFCESVSCQAQCNLTASDTNGDLKVCLRTRSEAPPIFFQRLRTLMGSADLGRHALRGSEIHYLADGVE
jgi:hypothetical protein